MSPMTSVSTEPRTIHETPATGWNNEILPHGGHVLQSWEWGAFKQRHGWQPERISVSTAAGEGHAQVLFRRKGPVSLGYIPRGPVIAGDAEQIWPDLLKEIDKAARRQ